MKRLQHFFSITLIAGLILCSPAMDLARSYQETARLDEEPRDADIVGIATQQGLNPDLMVKWSSNNPQQLTDVKPVVGLDTGEKIKGAAIDSETNTFIAVTQLGQLYRINPETGQATRITRISSSLVENKIAFDYDPATKKVRIINKQGLNIEILLSEVPALDFGSRVSYDADDINSGKTPAIAGLAHRRIGDLIDEGFFATDSTANALVAIENIVTGKMKTVGNLGIDISDCAGFDIAENTNFAFASFVPEGETASRFYEIDLGTGKATEIGMIGSGLEIASIMILLDTNPAKIECEVIPPAAINPVGTSHSIRVMVTKDGKPVSNALILINILAGPNKGVGTKGRAKDDPETQEDDPGLGLAYDSNGLAGTDFIAVGFIAEGKIGFCFATKTWVKELLISKVTVEDKKLRVEGCCFEAGDKIFINDKAMSTKRDASDPLRILIAKKGGKKLKQCAADFTNRVIVRRERPGEPVTDSNAFATCP